MYQDRNFESTSTTLEYLIIPRSHSLLLSNSALIYFIKGIIFWLLNLSTRLLIFFYPF